ncbi:cytochrome b-c1 complex subunit 2, mitochondrial [Nasonia vitripennis]|uniref:Cytochrome b-c1 complex subunit 2, mitochondrial n=1 Tax=Nasonia vitripennis TaxID=7425 RepID=A0A7M6UFT2_NASVI|nr:cytochrome b-c1 complex subunit 2, mitochondrial [Nasonia vitripennis]
MACSAMRYPLLRNPTVRHYAAAAAAQCSPMTNANIKVLGNKVTIAAIDNNSPVTQVSIIFKAGSRNETYDTQGISHMLRICTGLTTSHSTAFGITRNIQQLGGDLTTSSDREHVSYTLKITRNNLGPALKFLEDIATAQVFKPWEISDEIPRLRYEVSTIPDNVRLIELLYKAAYRDGLGYSLYCPKRQIGKISSETLRHFVSSNFSGPKCVVAATGIPLSELEMFAASLNVSSQDSAVPASKYHGGELRKERNSQLASVAVAVEGAALKNQKDSIAFAVLQKAAGDGPKVKWGGCNTPLWKAVANKSQDPFAIVSFNASHSDSGLFGFVLSAPGESAGELVKAGAKWLRAPKLSDDDIARGKATLKTLVLSAGDNSSLLHESVGHQVLLSGNALTPDAIAAEIDKISPADVKNAANQLSKGKLTVASIGNLSTVPYADEL